MAPVPKPPGRTRRSRVRSSSAVIEGGAVEGTPALGFDVSLETAAWWASVWSSPVAALWLDVDVGGLARLARLTDLVNGGGRVPATTLAEMRALEDRYGLNAIARRRLGWENVRGPVAPRDESASDDARWLRAIED